MGSGWYETWGENRIFGKIEATLNMRKKIFVGERPACGKNRIKKKVQVPAIVGHLLISLASFSRFLVTRQPLQPAMQMLFKGANWHRWDRILNPPPAPLPST